MMRRPGVGPNRRIGFRGFGGGGAVDPYTPAASAIILPTSAIWISQQGVTTADAGATADSWLSYLGGISVTLTAPASTNRPAYSAAGGVGSRPLLTFDGVDNVLTGAMTKGSAWTTREMGIVGQRVALSVAGDPWIGLQVTVSFVFGIRDSSAAALQYVESGLGTAVSAADPDGVVAHYSADNDGATSTIRVNGVVNGTPVSAAGVSRADGNPVVLGALASGISASNIAVQACYIGPALTTDQRTYLRALLTHYTGVAS